MSIPNGLYYTKDHEWAKVTGSEAVIGITDHAQAALGDIVFVDLPKKGRTLKSHETFGVVESIKAVSDLYSPLAGEVVDTNQGAVDNPASVNTSPYDSGWLIKIKMADPSALSQLMNPEAYTAFVESLK